MTVDRVLLPQGPVYSRVSKHSGYLSIPTSLRIAHVTNQLVEAASMHHWRTVILTEGALVVSRIDDHMQVSFPQRDIHLHARQKGKCRVTLALSMPGESVVLHFPSLNRRPSEIEQEVLKNPRHSLLVAEGIAKTIATGRLIHEA